MLIFISIVGLLFIHYLWLLFGMVRSFERDTIPETNENPLRNKFSIIIPFRNEAEIINDTIKSLLKLDYDKEDFEIILVNDHSEDDFQKRIGDLLDLGSIIIIDNNGVGKKEAIETGVAKAKNEWILCSDADCLFQEEWLMACNKTINGSSADLYLLPVFMDQGNGLLGRFQYYDLLSTLGFNMGYYFYKGVSLLANGANILFKKVDFQIIDPFKNNKSISSGDDMFLLQEFKRNGRVIKMKCDSEYWVQTKGQTSWRAFLDQRIRWVKKMKFIKSDLSFYIGIYISVIQLSLWISLFIGFFNLYMFFFFLSLILVKTWADFNLIKKISSYKNLHIEIGEILFFEFVYMLIVPIILTVSVFRRPVWKGRKILNRI